MCNPPAAPQGDGAPGSKALAFTNANDALSEIGQLNERFENRLTLSNLALAERYVRGDLKLLIEASWSSIEFNIVLYWEDAKKCVGGSGVHHKGLSSGASAEEGNRALRGEEHSRDTDLCSNLNGGGTYGYDGVMLVDDVKHMQLPERRVHSRVSFKPKEEPLGSGADAVYFGYTSGFKSFGLPLDRKPAVTVWRTVSRTNAVTNQVIQHTTEVVNDIAEDGANLDWDQFLDRNAVDILSGLRVFLSKDVVRVALVEGLYGSLKLRNVAFGPFNF